MGDLLLWLALLGALVVWGERGPRDWEVGVLGVLPRLYFGN